MVLQGVALLRVSGVLDLLHSLFLLLVPIDLIVVTVFTVATRPRPRRRRRPLLFHVSSSSSVASPLPRGV